MSNLVTNFWIAPLGTESGNLVFELSTTTDANIVFSSTVTSHPVPNGMDVSDNVVINPTIVGLRGRLTDVFDFTGADPTTFATISAGVNPRTIEEYIEDFRKLLEKKEEFEVILPTLGDVQRCVCTSFELSKTPELGGNAWDVSLDLQQVKTATLATTVAAPAAPFEVADKNSANGNTSIVDKSGQEVMCDPAHAANKICNVGRDDQGDRIVWFTDGSKYNDTTDKFVE